MEKYIAIDNVCAWPNIKKLPTGEIISIIFNQPCHLLWEGTIECWVSENNGRAWEFRGNPVLNEPSTNRGNVAVGLNEQNHIIVLCGGWDNAAQAPEKYYQGNIGDDRIRYKMKDKKALKVISSISEDNGKTWSAQEINIEGTELTTWIPFGDIILLEDGTLGCSMYGIENTKSKELTGAYFFNSKNNGKTWECLSCISPQGNETEMIKLPSGKIFAAVRKAYLDLYESDDNGKNWQHVSFLTGRAEYPAGFTLLNDGHLLVSYGIRHKGLYGIGAMTMHLETEKWNTPMVVADFGDAWDGGYPSNVQLDNGEIVTAYYSGPTSSHGRYHMGIIIWDWLKLFKG